MVVFERFDSPDYQVGADMKVLEKLLQFQCRVQK